MTEFSVPRMILSPSFAVITYLLASSKGTTRERRSGSLSRNAGGDNRNNNHNRKRTGRKRYASDGTKRQSLQRGSHSKLETSKQDVSPLPRISRPNDPRLTYFTCRHTYEDTLIEEIHRYASSLDGNENPKVVAKSPYPGLVRVEDRNEILSYHYDPVYALQSMPNSVVVSGESIKSIANSISVALFGDEDDKNNKISPFISERKERLRAAPRGSLSIHALVPGQCKGQSKPAMLHRCSKISEELGRQMKKVYPAARKIQQKSNDDNIDEGRGESKERWILQVMLQSPNIAVASITQCQHIGPGNCYWPNWHHPLGLANVDISEKMPSSAYRKLMEALECSRIRPSASSVAFDLGACPGGWTSVMRRLGCSVVAIDRSKIDPILMKDDMVEFIKGDAFSFVPTLESSDNRECWMISDVIAYPDKCTQLLERWCGGKWARHMVVTMKFQGEKPSFNELEKAISIVQGHGYSCRAKHFFNNKNEVTLMISDNDADIENELEIGILGTPMYPLTLN